MAIPARCLTERDRRYVLQAAMNAYDNRDREALERLILRLLSYTTGPTCTNEGEISTRLPNPPKEANP